MGGLPDAGVELCENPSRPIVHGFEQRHPDDDPEEDVITGGGGASPKADQIEWESGGRVFILGLFASTVHPL